MIEQHYKPNNWIKFSCLSQLDTRKLFWALLSFTYEKTCDSLIFDHWSCFHPNCTLTWLLAAAPIERFLGPKAIHDLEQEQRLVAIGTPALNISSQCFLVEVLTINIWCIKKVGRFAYRESISVTSGKKQALSFQLKSCAAPHWGAALELIHTTSSSIAK